jgi:hypothetical protein
LVAADHLTAADGEFAMATRDNHSARWHSSSVAFGAEGCIYQLTTLDAVVVAGGKTIEVARVRITELGRQAFGGW